MLCLLPEDLLVQISDYLQAAVLSHVSSQTWRSLHTPLPAHPAIQSHAVTCPPLLLSVPLNLFLSLRALQGRHLSYHVNEVSVSEMLWSTVIGMLRGWRYPEGRQRDRWRLGTCQGRC